MATITTDTFLDDGIARTAGETWTITDCALTIRTDTRWHAGSPASFTGSLGSLTCAGEIGSVIIDGTKVRWLAYTAGAGTVPAIGTTVSSGAVSGYLLGVWATVGGTPTAVGAAMPATGFLKFREVTGGTFSAGALSGISATASSADVVGWIEVVCDHASKFTTTPKGQFTVTGDWFVLGTTNGSRGQTFTYPVMGSGIVAAGVQIETAAGSDVYEWYAANNTAFYSSTYVPTDVRGKIVSASSSATSGNLTLCAATAGYLPPTGCKVRIPNVFLRQCTSAARATNAINAGATNRPTWNTGKYCNVSISGATSDWFLNFVRYGATTVQNSAIEYAVTAQQLTSYSISNCVISNPNGNSVAGMTVTACNGATVANVRSHRNSGAGTLGMTLTRSNDVVVSNVIASNTAVSGSPATVINMTYCSDCTLTDFSTLGGGLTIGQCDNIAVSNHNYCHYISTTATANPTTYLVACTNSTNITYENPSIGFGGVVANVHPYESLVQTTGNISGLKFRNFGTAASPLNTGSFNKTQYVWTPASTVADNSIKFARIYGSDIVTSGAQITSNAMLSNEIFDSVGSYTTPWLVTGLLNATIRGIRAASVGTSWIDAPGTHFADYFTSATAGGLVCNLGLPTASSLSQFTTSITPTSFSGFNDTAVKLVTVGDSCIFEPSYAILGHTAFQNVDPTFAATTNLANHSKEYDIDTGAGYTGTWKDLTGANLSAETISATGFRIKFKFVCTSASNTNAIGKFTILTTSTSTAQANNLYPLDIVSLAFTNLIAGSEVRVYAGTDPATATEIGGTESSGTTFSFTHSSGGTAGVIAIFAMGYQPIYLPYTFKSTDDSVLIQQVVDRNYTNP
jgi:hypothetical protein